MDRNDLIKIINGGICEMFASFTGDTINDAENVKIKLNELIDNIICEEKESHVSLFEDNINEFCRGLNESYPKMPYKTHLIYNNKPIAEWVKNLFNNELRDIKNEIIMIQVTDECGNVWIDKKNLDRVFNKRLK